MIDGISSQYNKPLYLSNFDYGNNLVNVKTQTNNENPVISKEEMEQLMSFAMYKQTGMTMKLVRTVGELYQGQSIDLLA